VKATLACRRGRAGGRVGWGGAGTHGQAGRRTWAGGWGMQTWVEGNRAIVAQEGWRGLDAN
jgi:hypothetical protein